MDERFALLLEPQLLVEACGLAPRVEFELPKALLAQGFLGLGNEDSSQALALPFGGDCHLPELSPSCRPERLDGEAGGDFVLFAQGKVKLGIFGIGVGRG